MSILPVLYTCSIVGVRQQSKNSLQTGDMNLFCVLLCDRWTTIVLNIVDVSLPDAIINVYLLLSLSFCKTIVILSTAWSNNEQKKISDKFLWITSKGTRFKVLLTLTRCRFLSPFRREKSRQYQTFRSKFECKQKWYGTLQRTVLDSCVLAIWEFKTIKDARIHGYDKSMFLHG